MSTLMNRRISRVGAFSFPTIFVNAVQKLSAASFHDVNTTVKPKSSCTRLYTRLKTDVTMEIFAGTADGTTITLLAEPVPKGSQCFCFTAQTRGGNGHTGTTVRTVRLRDQRMVTGRSDGLITVTDVKATEYERFWMNTLPKGEPVTCLDISQGGKFCFVGTAGGHIFVIDLVRQKLFRMVQMAHKGPILALRIHPERFTVFTVGADRVLSAWNPATHVINYVDQEGPLIRLIEFSPSGNVLALVSDAAINVISIESGESLRQEGFPFRPIAVCWLTESELCVGTEDGFASFFDSRIVNEPCRIRVSLPKMTAMAIDREKKFLVSADDSPEVILYKIEGNSFIRRLCIVEVDSVPTYLTLVAEEEFGLHRTMRQELEKDGVVFSDWD